MGFNNKLKDLRLNFKTRRVENALGKPIAILHQFDRRPSIAEFVQSKVLPAMEMRMSRKRLR